MLEKTKRTHDHRSRSQRTERGYLMCSNRLISSDDHSCRHGAKYFCSYNRLERAVRIGVDFVQGGSPDTVRAIVFNLSRIDGISTLSRNEK